MFPNRIKPRKSPKASDLLEEAKVGAVAMVEHAERQADKLVMDARSAVKDIKRLEMADTKADHLGFKNGPKKKRGRPTKAEAEEKRKKKEKERGEGLFFPWERVQGSGLFE